MTTHQGSCQCGSVAYEVETELDGVIECNCSHCYRKGLALVFVSPDAFRQTAGEGALSEHTFNTHTCSARPAAFRPLQAAWPRTASRWWPSMCGR
jgi:hypothetical protein